MSKNYKQFLTPCSSCGANTSKKYASEHNGNCKTCATGEVPKERICPDCGEPRLTAYQKRHGYHCDTCTNNVERTGGIYGF